ncbi:hypothetical protein [Nocardiopsis sp. LOL_012]|uniref:hypothetical protein n=1 Tax=Nocardiopsis sp. LOL_012 TaxID=3345409 RepID=UPI003A897617
MAGEDVKTGRVLRNRWTAGFGIAVTVIFLLAWLFMVVFEALDGEPLRVQNLLFMAVFFPFFWWFFLKVTFFTRVELTSDRVVVKNVFHRVDIPAREITAVNGKGRLRIETRGGQAFSCFNLDGSLLGRLTGHSTNQRCAREIEDFLAADKKAGHRSRREEIRTAPHLNLEFLLGAVLFGFVVPLLLNLLPA